MKNIHEAGYAAAVNGKTKVTVWGDEKPNEKCSQIIGTDGILVTPFRKKDEGLTFFARQLCATVHMNFKRKYSYRGIDCHVFEFKFEDLMNNMSCFCRESRECPLKGTMDLFPCVQAPVIVSHPHFLWGDPSLLANIGSGLSPVESKHEFVFNVEVVMIFFNCSILVLFFLALSFWFRQSLVTGFVDTISFLGESI